MNYFETIKKNSSALAVTYGSMVFEGAIMTLLIALMNPLSKQMNVDISTVSILITAQAIGTVSTIYIGGNMSDKIGRKKVILLGLSSYVLFLFGMFFTSNFYIMVCIAVFAGIGHGLMDSPSISMLIDIFGDHSGPAMSMVAVFFSTGGALSTVIVRMAIKNNIDTKVIFLYYLIPAAIMAILILKAEYPQKQKRLDLNKNTDNNKNKLLMRTAILLALITFLFSSGNSIIRTWISTYSYEIQGVTLEQSVGMLTYLQLGNIIGAFIFAYVLTKIHSTKIMMLNGIIATTCLVLFLNMGNGSVMLLMAVGAVLSISFSLSLNIIGELFIENSGQATGFIGTASMMSGIVMTFVSGRLLPIIGVSNLMMSAVFIIATATALAFVFRRLFVYIKTHNI